MPEITKTMVVAKPIGKFINGDQKGVMNRKRFERLAGAFTKFPRQVPIFAGPPHTLDLDSRIPDGWVEAVRVNADGDLEIDAKLHGDGAVVVVEDLVRGASIGTVQAKNPDGSRQGEVLHHVILTNNPFIKDLNIAAAQDQSGEQVVSFVTALVEEEEMAEKKKDEQIVALTEEVVSLKAKIVSLSAAEPGEAKLKASEASIIALKAEALLKAEEIETLNGQLANAHADKDKEAALVENAVLRKKDFLRDVRSMVEYGLNKGTILASEVEGYAGGHPLDMAATETWLKASKFFDASMPNPEAQAFSIIKHMATKTKPRVNIGARFTSGAPDNSSLTLSDTDKAFIREQGLDPARVANMTDTTNYKDWKGLPTETKD